MRTLPLSVLAYDGPIARAYLCGMRRSGLRPERVVLLVLKNRAGTGRAVGRWLPGGLRRAYARRVQDLSHNYWPREIRRRHPALLAAVVRGVSAWEPDAAELAELYEEMYGSFAFEQHADRIEGLLVGGYADPLLSSSLRNLAHGTVIYTGGGIVPPPLLALPGVRFLHVHPGHLPHVRGADGLLWSMLVRGRPGASAFFLDKDIDTGDIVSARELAPLRIGLAAGNRPDDRTLYRALFAFVDPVLRMSALLRLLAEFPDPGALAGRAQDRSVGITYHFMADEMRAIALRRIFVDGA